MMRRGTFITGAELSPSGRTVRVLSDEFLGGFSGLSVDEARFLGERLLDLAEQAENPTSYVQVRFPGTGTKYTYIDPSGELEIGDHVVCPVGTYGDEQIARVVALGMGGWARRRGGVVLKSVRSRLVETPLYDTAVPLAGQ